jgi:hypothetical protein
VLCRGCAQLQTPWPTSEHMALLLTLDFKRARSKQRYGLFGDPKKGPFPFGLEPILCDEAASLAKAIAE